MKQFKSESKRLLDLMINSIYTNKEIFLRELISNSSDAIDKLYYMSLTDKKVNIKKEDLEINIKIDKDNRTLEISDNGIGMSKEDLENNLGTICRSGSNQFKEMLKDNKDIDIIGQFGVGFYSAFMVSDDITVISKKINEEKAYEFSSKGLEGYNIKETTKDEVGTSIIIKIKEDSDEYKYSDFLDEYNIKLLIKKYSDYIRYPIKMFITERKLKDKEKNEYEDVKELQTINSMIPLWKKGKNEITEEELNNFYSDKFYDYDKPLKVIKSDVEGLCSYKSLLFIPAHVPFDFYTKEYEKGLSLYSNGVLIMEKCPDLLPDYFSFVKGVVDSEDISLNISREMLQKTNSLDKISKNIENKIKKELEEMLKNDKEKYIEFFKTFGMQLKFGVYNNYGMDKDKLKDLLMFYSSKTKELISLKEYISNMKDDQKEIYYASGESIDKIDDLPQVEKVKEKDIEMLYLTEYVDEFAITALGEYEGKRFVNISSNDFNIENEEEKEKIEKVNKENSDMLSTMKNILNISEVRFTNNLKNHPVCLVNKGQISVEMEKVINSMPTDENIKAELVLEINENHPISNKMKKLYKEDKDLFEKYSKIMYQEARLIEGLSVENPTELSNMICDLLSK